MSFGVSTAGALPSASNISPVGSPEASRITWPPCGREGWAFVTPSAASARELRTSPWVPFQNQTGLSGAARSSSARVGSRRSSNLVCDAEAPTRKIHSPGGVVRARSARFEAAFATEGTPGARASTDVVNTMVGTGWLWESTRPGTTVFPRRFTIRVDGPASFRTASVDPTATKRPSFTATADAIDPRGSRVTNFPSR